MLAVGTNHSHRFVEKLVESLSNDNLIMDALKAKNCDGDTALHYAAKVGNLMDAELLMSHWPGPDIALQVNKKGQTPLLYAAWLGRKKGMLTYMFYKADVLFKPPPSGIRGDLLTPAIDSEFIDLALELVEKSSSIVLRNKWASQRPLEVLASKPQLFHSTSERGPLTSESINNTKESHDDGRTFKEWFTRILLCLVQPTRKIYETKITHMRTKKLLIRMCLAVIDTRNQDVAWVILGSTIDKAIECGNYEVVEECILAYPSTIWDAFSGFYLFHSAIHQRQERVYNLVYQMTSYKTFVASYVNPETNENALHIAAKLAPHHRLNTITGAALQMQRELQWFNEVKDNFIQSTNIEDLNTNNKTPRMVFTDEHKDLLKEGQKWMKDTASSSTVVAALIVTVAFAATFTVPDAIALFSSVTSVLMFLGILTSRYAEGDFLHALPQKMMIGLLSLFLSLAATMVAFGATLALVLQDKVTWIAAPLVTVTSIPVALYAWLQFPLLKELYKNTYGESIFHKQDKRTIH
ncbi:hypothetical protein OSB04_010291 [Centaurea solstitialis]|uniref:PGG domain-containing protein n=1 Tax=Centaurea solstitialis TaxID=347529 RepID=A0AA38WCP7_9ASTR|nr:hypothetical protein OSB04_010291 [Centaurea solstitialis]